MQTMATSAAEQRSEALLRARRLTMLTLVWVGAEALLGLVSAWRACSVSLAAFGLDSLIELASAAVVLWRVGREANPQQRAHAEKVSLRVAAVCLLLLAVYVAAAAVHGLLAGTAATLSRMGLFVTASAVVLMPLLGRAKRRVGMQLGSSAMVADARQADFCAMQALVVLLGLLANHWWHLPQADSIASLLLVPLIVREGVRALQNKGCGCSC